MTQSVRRVLALSAVLAAVLIGALVAPVQAADAPPADVPPNDRAQVVGKASMALGGLLLGTVLVTRTRRRTPTRR